MLGVCYYPEHWDEARWETDARRMVALGIPAINRLDPFRVAEEIAILHVPEEAFQRVALALAKQTLDFAVIQQFQGIGRNAAGFLKAGYDHAWFQIRHQGQTLQAKLFELLGREINLGHGIVGLAAQLQRCRIQPDIARRHAEGDRLA